MNKEFVSYEQALELKELGFEEPCFGAWVENELFIPEKQNLSVQSLSNNQCLAPLYQQAFRFFREKYDKLGCIKKAIDRNRFIYLVNDIVFGFYDTYEEAEHACLLKLIELTKQK